MKAKPLVAAICFMLINVGAVLAQDNSKVEFTGQLSSTLQYAHDADNTFELRARYIPQLNYAIPSHKKFTFDVEASANILGETSLKSFNETNVDGKIKPYRLWARYSATNTEIRAGLQKINFGSALLLRPLMWFDELDPRDPLQLTNGVWGAMGRYHFKNNANVWLWALVGNDKTKGWEFAPTSKLSTPEFGGRFQHPIPKGEAALSFHYRQKADIPAMTGVVSTDEYRVGFDAKVDVEVGLWFEGSFQHFGEDVGKLTNQHMMTAGIDYTFGIGNGLGVTYEQLIFSLDRKPFEMKDVNTLSALSISYPIGLLDKVDFMGMYDWYNQNSYLYLGWQRQFDKITLNVIGYWNTLNSSIPFQPKSNMAMGKGIQLIFVWNH